MTRDEALTILRREKSCVYETYGVTKLVLFGSTARDEAGPSSDVDLVVEMPPDIYAQVGLTEHLERALGTRVDVVRDHSGLRPFFRNRLARDGVLV